MIGARWGNTHHGMQQTLPPVYLIMRIQKCRPFGSIER